jgi:type IV secretion system protein TrbG
VNLLKHIQKLAITFLTGVSLLAQEAVHLQRNPSPQQAQAQQAQTEYAKAAAVLKKPARSKKQAPPVSVPMIAGEIVAPVPGDKPILLPENAIEAIRLQSSWRNDAKPMLDQDGSIVYIYGQGRPNIPCAVGRVSTIQLAPGETLEKGDAEIGDLSRWTLALHQILRQGQVQTYVTVKPQYAGLDTTLTLFASRHAYHLRLLSDMQGIDQVSFKYPKEEAEAAVSEAGKQKAAEQQKHEEERKKQQLEASNTDRPITNIIYTVKVGKHAKYLEPVLVGDNGAHTLIQLSTAARHRPSPALQIVSPTGPGVPNVHYDRERLLFTVDGLFTEAQLIVGQGKHRLVVTIKNDKASA